MIKKLLVLIAFICMLPMLANAASFTMTASVTSGSGTASPASLTRPGGVQTTPPFFDFAPASGFHVQSVAVKDGLGNPYPAANYTLKNKSSGVVITLPAATGVTVRVAITNLTGNVTLGGVFTNSNPIANAGTGQFVFPSALVTLDGTASVGASSYTWTQYGGPVTVTLNTSNPAKPTFTPVVLGTYLFRLTINGGSSATTYVTVTTDPASVAWNQCGACHKLNGVGQGPPIIYNLWSSSKHNNRIAPNMCPACHIGTDTGGHPGIMPTGAICGTCHTHTSQAALYQASLHGTNPRGLFTNVCVTCHDPHSTYAARNICANCHILIGTPQALLWQGSKHNTAANSPLIYPPPGGNVTCPTCHNPHSLVALLSICVSCHTPGNPYGLPWPPSPDLAFHNDFTNTDTCVACHDPHSTAVNAAALPFPHFNNVTSYSNPKYTAMYVTPRTSCSYCHGTPLRFQNNTTYAAQARFNWASSGHGDVFSPAWKSSTTHDWKTAGTAGVTPQNNYTKNDCVRCHTAKGFTQFMGSGFTNIAPVGVATDKTSEPLSCNACHNTDSQTNPGFTLRASTDYTAYYNYSSTTSPSKRLSVVFNKFYGTNNNNKVDPGNSNLCIPCHAGRESGDVLWAASAANMNFNNANFINSHYLTGAGTTYQSTGFKMYTTSAVDKYAFTGGVTYHYLVGTPASPNGIGGTNGPCAGCHLWTSKPHSFNALEYAQDGSINNVSFCVGCHTGRTPQFFQQQKDQFNAALDAVEYLLRTKKGIYYNGAKYPYFFDSTLYNVAITNWGNVRTMGAAFNFNLLKREPGAWAHNPVYTKRLIYDTVDYLDDGLLGNTTLANLPSVFWTGISFLQIQPLPSWAANAQTYLDTNRP